MIRLVAAQIVKGYHDRPVLRDCSFSFDEIGTYALMGPNGSGKSTFLRICALLEDPDGGGVEFYSGRDRLEKNIELNRRITLVLPRIGVFNASVFKNVAYGLKIRKMKHERIVEQVDKTLEAVGLAHKKDQNALTLSSGETQRLGIARALAIEPEILFLDEPTASIDEENTGIVEGIILTLKREARTTVIITTHDRDQAVRLADRVLMMHDGRIVQLR
jgi:tungstate transport system ATP-binding protein